MQDVTHLLHPDDWRLVGDGAVDDGVENLGRAAVHRQVGPIRDPKLIFLLENSSSAQ